MTYRRLRHGLMSVVKARTYCHTEKTSFWLYYRALFHRKKDEQFYSMKRIICRKPTGKVSIVTNYRGSRKTFLARHICSWPYWSNLLSWPLYIDNRPELSRCVADGQVHWVAVAVKYIREEQLKLFIVLLITFVLTVIAERSVIPAVKKVLGALTAFLADQFTLPAIMAIVCVIGLSVIRLRRKIFVIDDVLGMESKAEAVQQLLRWLDILAGSGHRVVLLSSNEGIAHCFGDRNDTLRIVEAFPAPSVERLHWCLKDALHGEAYLRGCPTYCYPSESLITAVARVLPKHLALSMRLWLWVSMGDRWGLIEDVAAAKPLRMSQVVELVQLAKNLDLESERHFRRLALEHSAPYQPPVDHDNAIRPPTAIPRRLALISAIAQFCSTVEERVLLEELGCALTEAVEATISALRFEQNISTLEQRRLALEERRLAAEERRFNLRSAAEERRFNLRSAAEEHRFNLRSAAEERRFNLRSAAEERRLAAEERRLAAEERRFKEQMAVHPVVMLRNLVTAITNKSPTHAHTEGTKEDTRTRTEGTGDDARTEGTGDDARTEGTKEDDSHIKDTHAETHTAADDEGSLLWEKWNMLTSRRRGSVAERVVQRVATAELRLLFTGTMRADAIIDALEDRLRSRGAMVVQLAEEIAQSLTGEEERKMKLLCERWRSALPTTGVPLDGKPQLWGKSEQLITWKLLPDPADAPIGACEEIMRDVRENLQGSAECNERCKALTELEIAVCPLRAVVRKELQKRAQHSY